MTTTNQHPSLSPWFRGSAVMGLLLLCFAEGCASSKPVIVEGRSVPRVRLGYTDGKYFALTHADAYPVPRGPSSGLRANDGSVFGRVCGADVYLNSDYYRNKLELNGFVRAHSTERRIPDLTAWVRVRDIVENGRAEREFSGSLGVSNGSDGVNPRTISAVLRGAFQGARGQIANWQIAGLLSNVAGVATARSPVVDLRISPEGLHGRISFRHFQLTATEDDSYVGEMRIGDDTYRYVVFGKSALWSMPPADQAAILPLMLSCARLVRDQAGEPILFVDFSGKNNHKKN
jgi:hypothetical protein